MSVKQTKLTYFMTSLVKCANVVMVDEATQLLKEKHTALEPII